MTSLADRVLGDRTADDDDDLDLEDPELARQLAELQARRAARGGGSEPLVTVPDARPDPSAEAPAAVVSATPKSKSLADQILEGAGGGSDELEAMEQELEAQLSQYRKQRDTPAGSRGREVQGDLAAEAAAPAEAAPQSDAKGGSDTQALQRRLAASKKGQSSASPASTGQLNGGDSATDPGGDLAVDSNGQVAAASGGEKDAALAALRQEAASMDAAFPSQDDPAAIQAAKAAPKPKARREANWRSSREKDRKEAPMPDDILELQSLLNDVDVRLQGISDRQDLNERQAMRGEHASVEGARAIAELQKQNAHLRDRLADPKKGGLLELDRSVFGLVDTKPDTE